MGAKILEALIKVLAKNPGLLEAAVEAGAKLLVAELEKAVEKAKGAKA